jgi:hypothetical protein
MANVILDKHGDTVKSSNDHELHVGDTIVYKPYGEDYLIQGVIVGQTRSSILTDKPVGLRTVRIEKAYRHIFKLWKY